MRVLVVEDERKVAGFLARALRENAYAVDVVDTGEKGLELALDNSYDLVLLDLRLPGLSGVEVCQRLRRDDVQTPILMLTARSLVEQRVEGLDAGADDYLTKPFALTELLARVRAALRRTVRTGTGDVVTFDGISVDFTKMEVNRNGEQVVLTAQEFKTLKFLIQNAERVISRDELLNEVWGYQNYPSTRTVDNHILKLRQKLEKDPTNPTHFRTVHGMGYKFVR